MSDSVYIVREGDHLSLIAHRLGVDADEVWKNPKHDRLRKAGRTPDLLCVGDVIHYTAPPRKWLPVKVGHVNKFTVKVPKIKVTLTFAELANAKVSVKQLPEGKNTFTTDANGKLDFQAPVTTAILELVFPDGSVHEIRVGYLDPMTEESGLRQRLMNLGYLREGMSVDVALSRYQRDHQLTVTGSVNDDTRKHLEEAHAG